MSVGTPDYTRGVMSPQKLLATVAAGTASVTVGVPPNAETLIVVAADIADTGTIYAEGTSTLYKYAGIRLPTQPHMTTATTWIFDVSNTMDEQVKVVFADAPGEIWFVYADAGIHVVGDASALKSTLGQVYTTPSAPSTVAGDHPPVELSTLVQTNVASGATFLSAPGAGQRYRIMWATVCNTTTGAEVQLYDSVNGAAFVQGGVGPAGTYGITDMKPSGKPLSTGAAILAYASAGNANGTIVYTTENV